MIERLGRSKIFKCRVFRFEKKGINSLLGYKDTAKLILAVCL